MPFLSDPTAFRTPTPSAAKVPPTSGKAYGKALAYADALTLGRWTGGSGFTVTLFRWYLRLFGYPELAAHRRFGSVQEALHRGGTTVLDVGAGSGLYSIADAVSRPSGIRLLADVSRRHMHRAQATARALGLPLDALVCNAAALPIADDSIDAVLVIEVLQFTDDDVAVIAEVARVLRPGGRWICEQEIANDEAAQARLDARITPEARLTKRRAGHSEQRLRHLATAHGLRLESTGVISGLPSRWWERVESRILSRSRALHLVLFPLLRLLAGLGRCLPREAQPGTVLYQFRKSGRAADVSPPASEYLASRSGR